jgi:hypothetical protein
MMDDKRKTDLALKLLDNVQNLIKFADSKLNVLLIISGVTTTFVLANIQPLFNDSILSKVLIILFFVSFIIFLCFSMLTILPRQDNHTDQSIAKTIYFRHIASRIEIKDFINDYSKLDEKGFQTDLLYQIYETSKIADKKFKFYIKCIFTLLFQVLFCIVLMIIRCLGL